MNKRIWKKRSARMADAVRGVGRLHGWSEEQVREIVTTMLRCFGIKAVWP